MFHFFTKNEYLVDYLGGFIDVHNHILPGIDDGAKNINDSVTLLNAFVEIGITDFICTPHIMHNYHDNTPKTIKKSFESLTKKLSELSLRSDIKMRYAAEHMIDANFESLLENEDFLPLDKEHLLIEMSYLQASINFEKSVKLILERQLFPVFAHPERYVYLHGSFRKYIEYKQMGIKFQLNALSLFGYYGKGIQKIAFKLLKEGFFDFIATDTHNLRHISALKMGKVNKSHLYELQKIVNQTMNQFKTSIH